MEDALRVGIFNRDTRSTCGRLNPCFNGRYSQSKSTEQLLDEILS